jgi:chromosome segregation ATPase
MPKINRVRIVNFSYNNNNRHVIDECFDFYGGENALLSLANGGGKSVLVQAMLQPILPKVSLLGRKFRDFFISKKTPTYIMIEWKLDDNAGYLLTGIAIAARTSHSADEEDEYTDIRYFTFLYPYEQGNEFDVKHIPVAEQVDNSVRIASYQEFKRLLQKESNRNQRDLLVFDSTREEQRQYERKLESYGISKEEWKELIVNINEAENGVSEVFSQCKTSRKVMEQWIIKYIEKVLDKSADSEMTDHRKLEIMMAQVAQSLVDNEKHIREYKAIDALSRDLDSIYNDAKDVLTSLDNENRLKKDISEGYHVLKDEEQRLEQELSDMEIHLREFDNELKSIDHEEKSQEIYKYTEKIEVINSKLKDLNDSIERQKSLLDEKKYRLSLQKAAEKYGRRQEKERAIAQLRQRLENASKDQEALLKSLNRVKYFLKIAYNAEISSIKKEIEDDNKRLNDILSKIDKNRIEARECQKQIEKLIKEIGGIESEIKIFEKEEQKILEALDIHIYRNPLIKELDQREVVKVKEQLQKEKQETENSLSEKKNETDKLKEFFAALQQRKEELSGKHMKLKVEEAEILGRIKNFQDEKQTVLDALKRLNINTENLYDQVYLLKSAREYLNDWTNKEYNIKMEISELERQIHGIEKGVSYLPTSFLSILQENNLPCYTGEQYLREIDEETKKKLIERNPLLPYAIIATEKEITLIEQLASNMELSQIIPVISYSRRDQEIGLEKQDMRFISSSRNMALSNEDVGILIKELVEKKERKILELDDAKKVIERVNHDYQIITNFKWTQKEVEDLENELKAKKLGVEINEQAMEDCWQQLDDTNNRLDELAVEIETLKAELPKREKRIEDFESYLAKDAAYMENLRSYSRIESKISTLTTSKKKYEDENNRLETDAAELKEQIGSKKRSLRDFEDKMKEVADAREIEPDATDAREIKPDVKEAGVEDVSKLDSGITDSISVSHPSQPELVDACTSKHKLADSSIKSIAELEGELEAFKKQQNNEVSDLTEQIKGLLKDIQDIDKDIRKLNLTSKEYETIPYSESTEIELEEQCGKLTKEIKNLEDEKTDFDRKIARLNVRIEMAKEALGDSPIVPIQEIKGDFAARRREISRKRIENETAIKKIQENKLELTKLFVRIETEIKDIREVLIDADNKTRMSPEEIKASIDVMLTEYSESVDKSDKFIELFRNNSSRFINRYANYEEGTVKEAVKALQGQIETLTRSYEKYYYLAERVEYYIEQLTQILKIMESKMQQLEHSKKDLIEHAFIEARRIYYEIPKISENSAIEIDGVRKKVLEIQYEEMTDEIQAREKMSIYIQECLQSLTQFIKNSEDESKLRREIEKYMSTKELLNIISSLEKCRIRAYKVDLNEKNRRMLPWEDIIVKNSGGEKFVAYFSLLVALISYSRKQVKGYETFRRKEESKVLIMDNPFGPITSGHLLKPMFDIAAKYNTQLICLSDIKQGSVINSFDLIYMIKIRQNMMQEDFLEIEPVLLKELKQDEKLENVYLYRKYDQISIFE